jgi:hypothetical protein
MCHRLGHPEHGADSGPFANGGRHADGHPGARVGRADAGSELRRAAADARHGARRGMRRD